MDLRTAGLLLILNTLALPVEAQNAGRLEGRVVSRSGEGLAGVVVEVGGTRVATGANGRYGLELVAGSHEVRFRMVGRGDVVERVEIASGRSTELEVELATTPVQLAALSALADRTRMVGGRDRLRTIGGSAHTVERGEMARLRLGAADAHRVLRQVPGVNMQEEDGYGLRPNIGMRGTGVERSSKVAVMEDGVPVAPAPYSAPAAYYFPVVGRMDAIEVRKGSSQVKYGPWTTGGALNLVSSPIPQERQVDADLAAGADAMGKVHVLAGDSYEHVGWLAQVYRVRTDGFKELPRGGETGFDVRDYLVKLRANTGEAAGWYHEVELKAGRTSEESNETYLGLTDADFAVSPLRRYAASERDRMAADHEQYQVRWFTRPSETIHGMVVAYRNEFRRNWYKLNDVLGTGIAAVLSAPEEHAAALAVLRGSDSDADALRVRANNRAYVSQGVQATAGASFGIGSSRHGLEVGARYHEDSEDRFHHDDGYRMASARLELTTAGTPGAQANRISSADAWSFFLEDRIERGRVTLTPGVRYETIRFVRADYAPGDGARLAVTNETSHAVEVLVPGIGATVDAGRGLTLLAGAHRGFGPPGPTADERTRAEESVNYEVGARLFRGALALEAIGFHADYRNVLGRATLSSGEAGSNELFNGGAATVRGIEASATWDLALPALPARVPLRLAYTWTDGRFDTAFESAFDEWGTVEPGDELPYLPAHQLHLSAGFDRGPARVSLETSYTGAMRTRAGQGALVASESTDASLVLNASADYAVSPLATIYVSMQNVTDARYIVARRPAGARPGLPRTLLAGVTLSVR